MWFEYRAIKKSKIVSNKLEAEDTDAVVRYLRLNDYFPIEIKPVLSQSFSLLNLIANKITFNDIVNFTRQLAIMLNAGITLINCLDILKDQITKPVFKNLIEDLEREIREGGNFSGGLKKYPKYFSNLYISLVLSGEASGKLNEILLKLADNLEKQRTFRSKIKGALMYPVIIIIGMVVVMFIMITFVIPQLLRLYEDFNTTLPITTRILIQVSSFSAKFWPFILLSVGGLIFILRNFLKSKQGKLKFDSFLLGLPSIGNLIKMSVLVDATRTLSLLIASGVSILDCLTIVSDTTGNSIYQNSFKTVLKHVQKGISLGDSLKQENVFPQILVQMTMVGEQTGHLDETMMRISRYFELESEEAIKTATTLIEPAILVVLGIGITFLVMAVITPIYTLTSSIK